jgi:hypothetical protein
MRPLIRLLSILALVAAPLHAVGGTTATMQVSFTIVASCAVDARGATAPAVNCGQSVGYIVAPQAAQPASAGTAGVQDGWTVYF